ncbi:MAG: metal ABC transporter permease [Vallitaleaceae bacterium]|jgi:zinc transport system permease protein|nr:metal ABC transporter permease [Vallitaleaceae bacterium]
MLDAILNYNYMQHAVIAALLSSIICGIMGTIIVEKRLVSMSGGIAHASFGGIGAGYFLGVEPILGGLVFATITSLSVGQIKRKTNTNADAIISMFWSAGMALGILFIALTPGYPPDMTSYLFGDILAVNNLYLKVMIGLTILIVFVIGLFFSYWKLYLFDEEYAKIMGIKVLILEIILYILIALSIVILIKVVGVILSIAMLTIPPAIAKLFTHNLKWMMAVSGILGAVFGLGGLTLSYYINIPSGATIILVAITGYFVSILGKSIFIRRNDQIVE